MALIKTTIWKDNYTGEYWTILKTTQDKHSNLITIEMGLFKDKIKYKTADPTAYNDIKLMSQSVTVTGFDLQRKDIYPLLKISKMITKIVTPAVQEVKDSEGNIITPAVAEITETVESNILADAVDDL